MDFSDIEAKRHAASIEQNTLCDRAGVHNTTYSRLKTRPGPFGASERTLRKLRSALNELVEEKLKVLKGEQSNG